MMANRFRQNCVYVIVFAATCWLPAGLHAQAPSPSQDRSASAWQVLGRSLEDRVIEYRQFGEGERQVLVVGPLDGDETAALELVESLAEHLERFPRRSGGVQVTIVRDPNPDGRLRRTAANARGVLLDRNFPTRGWRKLPSGSLWLSGREPESEPETRALVDILDDVQPARVIVLSAIRRPAELTYFGPSEELARDFAKLSGLRPMAANLIAEQGSLAVFTGADRNVPTLVLRVPGGMRRDLVWTTYKRGLLAAIGGNEAESDATDSAGSALRGIPRSTGGFPTAAARNITEGVPYRNITSGEKASSVAQPQAVLATSKRAPAEVSTSGTVAGVPRVLSAEELESGGELVPVTPVRREFGPAAAPTRSKASSVERSVPNPRATIRANSRGAFPPAALARPGLNTPRPLPFSITPSQSFAAPQTTGVERLPAVDRSPPPSGRVQPRPIPLYPETGF